MDVAVGAEIRITDPIDEIEKIADDYLTIVNPEYLKNERLGYSNYNVPRYIKLYKKVGNTLILPFGCLQKFVFRYWHFFNRRTTEFSNRASFRASLNINLYDYQKDALTAMSNQSSGIVVAPCGSGKTNIALAYIAKIGYRALWITHTQDLLKQSMQRAQDILAFECDKPLGTITEGKVDCGNAITFATVQTLAKLDLTGLKDYFNIVIVDECHHAVQSVKATSMFAKVMNQISARHKFGVTATPYRSDKLERGMFALIGDTIHIIPNDCVKDRTVPFVDYIRYVPYEPTDPRVFNGDGTLNNTYLIGDLVEDVARNNIIAQDIIKAKGTSLVLSERIIHLEHLYDLVSPFKECTIIKSAGTKKAKEERAKALQLLNEKKINVVFATYQLAKEGLDVPTLNNLFFASPTDNKAVVVQSTGRVTRKAEGKECGYVYDYVDSFRPLARKARNRINIRKKIDKDNYKQVELF